MRQVTGWVVDQVGAHNQHDRNHVAYLLIGVVFQLVLDFSPDFLRFAVEHVHQDHLHVLPHERVVLHGQIRQQQFKAHVDIN